MKRIPGYLKIAVSRGAAIYNFGTSSNYSLQICLSDEGSALVELGIPPRGDQDCFQCQLTLDVTIAVDAAALHEAVMHHA